MYSGIYDVYRSNPKLCPSILSSLHQHVSTFLDLRPDCLNPVRLKLTVLEKAESVMLVEPLGRLLACLVACKLFYESMREQSSQEQADDDEEEDAVTVLNDVCILFDVLTEKLSDFDIDDIEFDQKMEFGNSVVGQKNLLYAQIMASVLEALMHHTFSSKSSKKNGQMKDCIKLFKVRQKIVDLVKSKSLLKKGDRGRPSNKSGPSFPTILRLSVLSELFSATQDQETPSEEEEGILSNVFSECYDFQLFLLSSAEHFIGLHKTLLPFERDRHLPYLRAIAKTLFVDCYLNLGTCDSDDERQVSRLRQCLTLLGSLFSIFYKFHKDKIEAILKEITGKSASKDLDALAHIFLKGCQKMIVRILNHDDRTTFLKDATSVLQIMAQVIPSLSYDCNEIERTNDWLSSLAKEHVIDHSPFCEELVKILLMLDRQLKTKLTVSHLIAQDIYRCLGDNDQNVSTDEDSVTYKIITEDTVGGLINVIVNHISDELMLVEHSLKKQKAFLLTSTEHKADAVEDNINIKLGNVIRTFHEIIRCALPLGPTLDLVIKKADKLYAILSSFVRYYLDIFRIKACPRISEKFERLVHMSCELLSDPLYLFLNYLEDVRSKKIKKSSSLQVAMKESKLIPSLVFSIEKFEKLIIQLSRKSKVDLHKNMKLSTLRDFKIHTDVLAQQQEEGSEEEDNPQKAKRKRSGDKASQTAKKKKIED